VAAGTEVPVGVKATVGVPVRPEVTGELLTLKLWGAEGVFCAVQDANITPERTKKAATPKD
jgi:hypothetical protein